MSDGRKFYCYCDANCRFETMSKEQILAAIAQAAESGLVFDTESAFITKVKEDNAGGFLTFWVGTQAQYNAIATKDANCFYHITDSTKDADVAAAIAAAVKAIDDHAADKNNPHGVTIAQIGAAPAGYGLGGDFSKITDANLATVTGKYATTESTLNLPVDGRFGVLDVNSCREDKGITQIFYPENAGYQGYIFVRACNNGTWGDWADCSPSAFAPAGYGLGSNAKALAEGTDLNDVTQTGWYATKGTSVMYGLGNVPAAFKTGGGLPVIRVESITPQWLVQTFYRIDETTSKTIAIAIRQCASGTWSDWVDCSPSAFAPSGYSEQYIEVTSEDELDTQLSSIIATMPNNSMKFITIASNKGDFLGGSAYGCRLFRRLALYGCASMFSYGITSTTMIEKTLYNGVWEPSSWVNPYMAAGAEYCTTERWQGKPVYTTLIRLGRVISQSIEHRIANIENVIYISLADISGKELTHESSITALTVDKTNIDIVTAVTAGEDGYLTIKYTKTTD